MSAGNGIACKVEGVAKMVETCQSNQVAVLAHIKMVAKPNCVLKKMKVDHLSEGEEWRFPGTEVTYTQAGSTDGWYWCHSWLILTIYSFCEVVELDDSTLVAPLNSKSNEQFTVVVGTVQLMTKYGIPVSSLICSEGKLASSYRLTVVPPMSWLPSRPGAIFLCFVLLMVRVLLRMKL